MPGPRVQTDGCLNARRVETAERYVVSHDAGSFCQAMVWALLLGEARAEIGFGYSSLPEAQIEAEKLKRMGYKVLSIKPIALPKPNS